MGIQALEGFEAPATGSAVTIGAYDGVHSGHRALLGLLREEAGRRGLASVVATFDRHPASVVRPESAPRLLCDTDQKLELLDSTGVDHVVVIPFDHRRSQEEAPDFVRTVLAGALGARVVAVGEDFHFGRGRRGDVALLREMGAGLGFEVVHLPLVGIPGGDGPVSSTAVRRLVEAGDVEGAAVLLDRPYEVRGRVVRGEGRGGRDLGFPTANVSVAPELLLPAAGIYAGWCALPPDPRPVAAAISLGVRPTFAVAGAPAALALEAHLLDFDADLYGSEARVRFVRRLRDEARYESVPALVAQIRRDVEETRRVLARP